VRVIVLDGNENQAVACVRSLGRAGSDVMSAPTLVGRRQAGRVIVAASFVTRHRRKTSPPSSLR
jgi:hypothetical protein